MRHLCFFYQSGKPILIIIFLTRAVSFIGLFLIAIGTGGIKPCVAPFGAEQFKLPQQEAQLGDYFSWFYAAINAGSMISALLTPNLRNTKCLGQENCFPLAFGVPSAIMAAALGDLPDCSDTELLSFAIILCHFGN